MNEPLSSPPAEATGYAPGDRLEAPIRVVDPRAQSAGTGPGAEACLEALLRASGVGTAVFDLEHRFVRVNPTLAAINGIPAEEHIGRGVRELLPATGAQVEKILEQVVRTGEAVRGVRFVVDLAGAPEGERHLVADYHPVRDADGSVTGSLALLTETTEQVRAERRAEESAARVRAVVDGLPDVAHVYDAEWRWVHMNPAAAEWLRSLGRDPEALIGRCVWEEFADTVGSPVHEASLRAVREGREVVFETYMEAAGHHFETRVIPIAGGTVSLSREITARRAAEQELRLAKEMAEQASRAKSQFLAVMSHELRTPLNAILGYHDLLDAGVAGELSPRQRQYLSRIRESGEQLLELIGQILGLARIEAGKEETALSWVDLAELVERCVALIEPAAHKKALTIDVVAPAGPLPVYTDPSKVRQILLNLLSNAVKFTEAGEIAVAVAARPDGVRVEVRDTGIGIAEADLERVFDPFTQVDDSTTRRQGGTGLGLTVSRRLVRLLGGDLVVRSAPGEGSCFTLSLPPTALSAPEAAPGNKPHGAAY